MHIISTRYAIPTIILLLLALIPTLLHSYLGSTYNDGKSAHNISTILSHYNSSPSQRNDQWGMDTYGSEDWIERIYLGEQGREVKLFVARAYDQKRLYHHPELSLSYGRNLPKRSISTLPEHPEITVHLLSNKENSMIVAYVLMYDDTFIENPIKHQFNESLRLLVSARKPMTLFYVSQLRLAPNTAFAQSDAAALLSLAIQSFQTQTNAEAVLN